LNHFAFEPFCAATPFHGVQQEETIMRNLNTIELSFVSGGAKQPASHPFPPGQHPSKRNPAHAPGESYKGPADKNFGPK
jgi:hypothetical protein